MFGTNERVGKRFFKTAPDHSLLVATRFFTLQGEGPYRGHPAYFIRLAKCNLACSFCDTSFDEGDWYPMEGLLEEADTLIHDFFKKQQLPVPAWANGPTKKMVLVITGGEPSLQPHLPVFLQKATPYFQHTQIESNGIPMISGIPDSTTLVISPKCLEKKGTIGPYLKPHATMLARADCLKFVLSAPEHEPYAAYSDIPSWAHDWANNTGKPVFISPMNRYKKEPMGMTSRPPASFTIDERSSRHEIMSFWEPECLDLPINQRNHEYAGEYCMKYGFILNLQIHLFANLP